MKLNSFGGTEEEGCAQVIEGLYLLNYFMAEGYGIGPSDIPWQIHARDGNAGTIRMLSQRGSYGFDKDIDNG